MIKVIAIVGATGVGKTKLSIDLCKFYQGQIINADASQLHKQLNIGTAKIQEQEKDGIPHHMIDILDCLSEYSIKEYVDKARQIIDQANFLPFIVGGSGLYIKSLIYTYNLNSEPRQNDDEFKNLTNEEVHAHLQKLDSNIASKAHYNNRKRVLRYIELARQYGKVVFPKQEPYYDALIICLYKKRDQLYFDINKRCEQMFSNGWIDEARNLKKAGYDLQRIKEIGYKEIDNYLQGMLSFDELISEVKKQTRHYAKKQMTWFRNQMDCLYIDANEKNIFDYLVNEINEFIKK